MREHCLALNFADEQTKLISYGQLAIRTADVKTIRLIKLGHLFKAWRDSNTYRKFLMAANLSAAHISKQATIRLVSQIFHALKVNKESEKFELMQRSLNSDFQPQISKLQQSIQDKSGKALTTQKIRSLQAIANQNQAKIMSYLSHWKNVCRSTQYTIRNSFKLILMRLCNNKLQTSFDTWKLGLNKLDQCKEQRNITLLADEGKKIGAELQTLIQELQEENDRQSRSTKASFHRAVQVCIKRHLKQCLQRWHNKCQQMHQQEQGAKTIMQKWRYSLIRQTFKNYIKQIEALRQEDRCQARLQFQIQLKKQRSNRKIFDAIYRYVTHFQKAKRNLGVLSNNLDIWVKRNAFVQWNEGKNRKILQWIQNQQQQNVELFDVLNHNLGEKVKAHTVETLLGLEYQKGLKKQGQKVLANTFARFYYIKAHRGIKKWVDFCKHQRHCHHILKSTIHRLDKNRMYFMKAAFKNWIGQTIIQEQKAKIKRSLLQSVEAEQMMNFNRAEHKSQVQLQRTHIDESKARRKQLQSKFKQVVAMISTKIDGNYYQSAIRHMFIQWAKYTKRQTRFVKSIITLVTKSMWQNGFSNISAFANDKHRTRLQNRAGVGMKRMFWKQKIRSAFNQMRSNRYIETVNTSKKLNTLTCSNNDTYSEFVSNTKRWTAVKGIVHINRSNLSNLFASWRNVTRWQKTQKDQSVKFECWNVVQAAKFLQKLSFQTKLTIKFRSHLKKFKIIKDKLYKNSVLQQLKIRNQINRNFYSQLNMVAHKIDTRMLEHSFRTINGFKTAKVDCHVQSKAVSAKELCSLLHQMYLLRMTFNLSQIKVEPYTRNDKPLERILKRVMGRNLRYYFQKMRQQTHKASVVQEVNEGGPIVDQALDEQVKLACYSKFLTDQGFTQLETEKVENWAKDRAKEHLTRVVSRMQHFTKDNHQYLKPLCFDRWRQFCRYRKLMGFHLRNMNNRLQHVKSDLSIAFNRWKYSKRHALEGIDIRNLISKCANDERRKEQLYELEDSAKQFTEQLTIQRDELVDNYIKSQRMACALARDNKEMLQHKAFSNMQRNANDRKKYNYEMVLSRNINMIQSLKDRIREFEIDNHSLANENEELRQFSLDGYQIAKNVQSLSHEREHLSVDLADKAHTIQKLLDQNAELQRQLKQAQDSAVGLIQLSHNNMRRMRHY